ncbi:eps11J [Vibrio ishigakensis]|uniref:Eps11J n=1 Tax=Vibrio ishigakensis TaxID=1481914 RepID=A0A0B8P8L6_9VIBR|nr:eps11J [Vibrio ishigakensis]
MPQIFRLRKNIQNEIEDLGITVSYFDERPSNSTVTKGLIRLGLSFAINNKIDAYYRKILLDNFDYLLIINPEAVPFWFIKEFKRVNPRSQVIIYTWDSFGNKSKNAKYINLVDRFYSFDNHDSSIDSRIIFLPLFYASDFGEVGKKVTNDYKYNACFVGTLHSSRYNYVNAVESELKKHSGKINLFKFFYFQSKVVLYLKYLFSNEFSDVPVKDVSFSKLSRNEVVSVISDSRIVIDLEHKKQKGLTMRTIEALGAKRKLITTNKEIIHYDFYSEDNILVVDRNDVNIPHRFLLGNFKEISDDIYTKYSISSWVKKVLEL